MAQKIEAVQMGRDGKKQPIIGIFNNNQLVTQLTVDRIAQLYIESGASLAPKVKEVLNLWHVWVVKTPDGWFSLTDVYPEGDSPEITFRSSGKPKQFATEDIAVKWLFEQVASMGVETTCQIFLLDGTTQRLEV